MGAVAACGLVYEYLLAHYAGRILGAVEPTVYAMIGLMIVAMGAGAFAARWVASIYRGFAWLELGIGVLGGSSVLVLSAAVAFAYSLPEWLRTVYGVDAFVALDGGLPDSLLGFARFLPFLAGFAIGFLIGMEIPLVARVREHVHGRPLTHNLGTMYGADYLGAGVGAAVWVAVCLKLPVVYAAVGTAAVNTLVGVGFLLLYRRRLRPAGRLWAGHGALAALLAVLAVFGSEWMVRLGDTLFEDRVVHRLQTRYQHAVITKRHVAPGQPDVLSLYLNGRLQFASNDERIYHAYLTTPAMLAAYRREKVLILGGGDGLALRDLLRWDPESVTPHRRRRRAAAPVPGRGPRGAPVAEPHPHRPQRGRFRRPARADRRGRRLHRGRTPGRGGAHGSTWWWRTSPIRAHPDLNRLYSDYFFARIRQLLSPDGVFVTQSSSPFHAKAAFVSIGRTLAHAGFHAEQYHANVPSFGEWGWTLGTPAGKPASVRIAEAGAGPTPDGWLTGQAATAAFVFPNGFFHGMDEVRVNRLGSHTVYGHHQEAWGRYRGVFFAGSPRPASPVGRGTGREEPGTRPGGERPFPRDRSASVSRAARGRRRSDVGRRLGGAWRSVGGGTAFAEPAFDVRLPFGESAHFGPEGIHRGIETGLNGAPVRIGGCLVVVDTGLNGAPVRVGGAAVRIGGCLVVVDTGLNGAAVRIGGPPCRCRCADPAVP